MNNNFAQESQSQFRPMKYVPRAPIMLNGVDRLLLFFVAFTPVAALVSYTITFAIALFALAYMTMTALAGGKLAIRSDLFVPFLLLCWMGLSLTWTREPEGAAIAFANTLSFQIAMFLFARSHSFLKNEKLFVNSMVAFFIVSVLVCLYVLLEVGTLRPAGNRFHWVGAISTRVAAQSLLLVPVAFYLIAKKKYGIFPHIMVAALIIIGFVSESRSGVAGVIASVCISSILIVSPYARSRSIIARIGIVILAGLSASVVLLNESGSQSVVIDRISNTNLTQYWTGSEETLVGQRAYVNDWGRTVMYTTGIDLIKQYSLIGSGIFSAGPIAQEKYNHFIQSHNAIIIMFGELGLIGGAIATTYLFILIRKYQSLRRSLSDKSYDTVFVKMLGLIIVFGLVLAQYKTMQDNIVFFGAIGVLFSMSHSVSRARTHVEQVG